jgi:hypothetical protein
VIRLQTARSAVLIPPSRPVMFVPPPSAACCTSCTVVHIGDVRHAGRGRQCVRRTRSTGCRRPHLRTPRAARSRPTGACAPFRYPPALPRGRKHAICPINVSIMDCRVSHARRRQLATPIYAIAYICRCPGEGHACRLFRIPMPAPVARCWAMSAERALLGSRLRARGASSI